MKSSWYQTSKMCTALRKHVLRVDLCVFIDEETTYGNVTFLNSTIKSILTAAIIKGLDVIGILTKDNPSVGWKAVAMAKQQKMDISVVPGQSYICKDREELYIYKLKNPIPQGLTLAEACDYTHKQGGFVLATNLSKRQVQMLDKLQNSNFAPDAVEIFNAKVGGYRDIDIDFQKFMSSGATSATDLENTNVFTYLDRKSAEKLKLIAPEEGVDFTPKYLEPIKGKYNV
jgi:hypothetical protein